MQRNAIKGVNVERHRRRNNILASRASSGRLHLVQKSYCHDRAVFIVSLRGQYRRAGVFGQRLAWGERDGRNTGGGGSYPSAKPVSNGVSERRHCHGTRAFFMFAFLRNNAPRPRPMPARGACPVENGGSTLNTREERGDHITLRCRDRNISVGTLRSTQIDRMEQSDIYDERRRRKLMEMEVVIEEIYDGTRGRIINFI